MKLCLTKDEHGNFEEHETFKGFTNSQKLLDKSQYFARMKGNKTYTQQPLSSKKYNGSGVAIPKKAIYCRQCKEKDIL